tara:strand:- start:7650 stop:8402 length:753 start_codon:yes stop_codon:yes gene_type:complete
MRYGRPNAHKRTLPNVFNKKQLITLFENIEDPTVFVGSLLSLFCGLRISEVCNLKKQDIDLEAEKVMVRGGKGDKDRIVMLPNSLKPLVEKWFRFNKESEYFLPTMYNKKYHKNMLSQKFRKCLAKSQLKIKTFITKHGQQRYAYSFHTLRHTYATYLLEKGVDLYYVQRSLGHVDIHTTQIYAYISNKDLQNKINQAFGRKKKTNSFNYVNDPYQLLKLKFANNEISLEEFREKFELLKDLDVNNGIFV